MRRLLIGLLVILVAFPALAQRRPPPVLMAQVGGKLSPMQLKQLDVDVQILGYLAETRMTMTFYNPNDRRLAGDLYFPLPEGSTISGYALDIGGKMVDGVAVGKHKARQAFEKEVRKGIDPGIVEWTKGNNFKTRVFPIPPKGTRTIMVRYAAELVTDDKGINYFLPLNFNDKVASFKLRVEVIKPNAPPVVKAGGLANFSFGAWRDSYVAETELKDRKLTEDLMVSVPDVHKKHSAVEQSTDGEFYFAITDSPPAKARTGGDDGPPSRITLLWDASGSRGKTDHKRELEILKEYFSGLKKGSVKVDVVLFRNAAQGPERFKVANGNAQDLLKFLAAVKYDGGTQMSAISPARVLKRPDMYLLFSDGMSNFGREEPKDLDAPVFAISGDATANHAFLRYVAMQTGGAYFNLNRVENAAVIAGLGKSPFSFMSAKVTDGKIVELYPTIAQPVMDRFALVGKLRSRDAKLVIEYGINGKVTHTVEYELSQSGAVKRDLHRIFWAQKKINELVMLADKNLDELTATGKEYGLVTPGTSLIVLETLEQYVEHKIVPPESLPDMRKAYFEQVEAMAQGRKAETESKIQRVLAMWQERVDWWNKEFKYPPNYRHHGEEDKKSGAMREEARDSMRDPAAAESAADDAPAEREAPEAMARAVSRPKKKAKNGGGEDEVAMPSEPQIEIKEWSPDVPYLKVLKKTASKDYFEAYMNQRAEYADSPAFYLDCAGFLFKQKQNVLALQVLSNIAELELENPALMRVLAHRLAQQELLELASLVFEEVLLLRPEEPQSYRDLALVLDRMERFERAIGLLKHVVMNQWDRFDQIEVIALMELNRVIARATWAGFTKTGVDDRLIKLLDVDVRIIMTWDADLTDMDLWVTEASGEKAYYGNNRTVIGGLVSRDFTQGYGPEEYVLKRSMPGEYKIESNFYGSGSPALTGGVTVQVDVFTNYGRKNEKVQSLTIRLDQAKDVVHIGTVKF